MKGAKSAAAICFSSRQVWAAAPAPERLLPIAEMAKRLGILTVAVVTTPFYFEGKKRMENAMGGIARLRKNVDSIIISMSWI